MGVTPTIAWIVTVTLFGAAVIDGRQLRVPNWLTFPFAAAGLATAAMLGGMSGLLGAIGGLAVGLALLLPLYAIGGMGAGDVKLLAGTGAWLGGWLTAQAFAVSVIVGALMALVLMARSGQLKSHLVRMVAIAQEILSVRDPVKLSELAAARKPRMLLLPYGIPLAVGTISFLAWQGLLV